ncbi:hypothetical protein PT974_09508 [Cladobotryum mycophilum]|uniref:Nuclear distribution protein n=1 Tax=Cladobotryum mycophilum TaxID=491253 RepID=A0ABR0SHK2_9HYPO
METMENSLDQTSLATISLLESRLLRIEHLLYGASTSPPPSQNDSALRKMSELDRRFAKMVSDIRVYSELLKIYRSSPDLFHAPAPSEPPSQLPPDTIRSIVMSSASSFNTTLSALTAVKDMLIPNPAASATLISLSKRMKGLEATQLAQAAEIAQLRTKSEMIIRSWYENSTIQNSELLADAEARVQRVERELRRKERQIEEEKEL